MVGWGWAQILGSGLVLALASGAENHGVVMSRQSLLGEVAAQTGPAVDWSDMPVSELVGTELEWSAISCDTRSARSKNKRCLFCCKMYTGGPVHIREHLDGEIKPRHVSASTWP